MPAVNWLAVIVAAIAAFGVGAIWYSPLMFTKAWLRESGVDEARARNVTMPLMMAKAFVLVLLATAVFAMFLGPNVDVGSGALYGFLAGLFWVTGYLGVNYLFEQRSLKLFLINGGYNVLSFTLMGAVLGAMA
ncbi:MAG TPA: DUF1761 domain-containing protein [Gammaproteobacteria bacterium]|nr:DUF1761 domain-containing protein [Gammaproteobacteria bacterium]